MHFLKSVNEEVSSNNKDDDATIMDAVPNISHVASRYVLHRLHVNVQFSVIEKYAINENRSIHNLYGSIPQKCFVGDISEGTG